MKKFNGMDSDSDPQDMPASEARYMPNVSLQTKIEIAILFIEIKAVEKVFKRNQQTIQALNDEQDELIKQLGVKLDRIQAIAEERDAESMQNEIDNDR